MECYCSLRNIQDLMVDCHPIFAKDISRSHQFGPKVLPDVLFGYVLYAGRILKAEILIADIDELEQMDACKNPDKFYIPSRRWNSQNSWRRSTSETIHLNQGSSGTRRGPIIFRASPTPHQDESRRDDAMRELKMISGLLREISFIAITWNPDSNSTCREKNHFLFLWSTSALDVLLDKHIEDCWKVEGQASQDSFSCMKGHLTDIHGPDGDLRGNKQPRDPTMYGQMCGKHVSDAAKSKAKQKWAIEKPKLDNARQWRGILFIDLEDEFKHTMKNVRRKLEIPMPAAMPCKTPANCGGEICHKLGNTGPNMLVLSKLTNLWEYDWKVRRTNITKITFSAKGINSLSRYNMSHKFIPMPQASKNTRCGGCSGKRMGKLEKPPAWQLTNARNKN